MCAGRHPSGSVPSPEFRTFTVPLNTFEAKSISFYAGYRGVPPATSPLPNKDQGIDQRTKYIGGLPVDMSKRLAQADRIVSTI